MTQSLIKSEDLSAEISAKSIVNFGVRSDKHRDVVTPCRLDKNWRTISTSQKNWCFGIGGWLIKMPLSNLTIAGVHQLGVLHMEDEWRISLIEL